MKKIGKTVDNDLDRCKKVLSISNKLKKGDSLYCELVDTVMDNDGNYELFIKVMQEGKNISGFIARIFKLYNDYDDDYKCLVFKESFETYKRNNYKYTIKFSLGNSDISAFKIDFLGNNGHLSVYKNKKITAYLNEYTVEYRDRIND